MVRHGATARRSALARIDDAFVGSGSRLAFAGRWRITALIERQGDSVEVSMDS